MVFSSLEVQRRLIHTKVYHKFFYSAWKEKTHKPSKAKQLRKTFSLVCILLVDFAWMNYFQSMWQLDGNVFYKSLSLRWGFFALKCFCVVWNKWYVINLHFNFYLDKSTTKVKVQCKYQSSKMKLSDTKVKTLQSVFTILIKFPLLLLFFDATIFLYKWL